MFFKERTAFTVADKRFIINTSTVTTDFKGLPEKSQKKQDCKEFINRTLRMIREMLFYSPLSPLNFLSKNFLPKKNV